MTVAIAAMTIAGCGSDDSGSGSGGSCVQGQQSACTCEGGLEGIRICDATGSYGQCACATCGNGVLEDGEECDGASFGAENCASQTMGAMSNGALTCNNCIIDPSGCTGAASPPPPSTGGAGGTPTTGAGGSTSVGGTVGAGAVGGGGP